MNRELGYVLRVALFCLPLAILIGFPLWVTWRSGELMPNNVMVQDLAGSRPVIIGLDLSSPVDYLDLQSVILRGPEVLVLGSSRVGRIRSTFFDKNVSIFVASGLQKIGHFAHFLDKIPANKTPKLLVMSLDQKFFNPNYDNLAPDDIDDLLTQQISATDVLSNWPVIYGHYLRGDFSLPEILHSNSSLIGLVAIMKGIGYRNDGSTDSGPAIYAPNGGIMADINQGTSGSGFEYGNIVSQGSLAALDNFLSECQKRGIYVIGIEPPFSPQVYEKMLSMSDDYGYMNQIPADVSAIFRKYGFEFYNYTDPKSLGIADKDMEDGMHTTERGSLMFFSSIAEKSSVLQQYTDPQRLKDALNATSAEADIFQD
jgi:hypothetical protein